MSYRLAVVVVASMIISAGCAPRSSLVRMDGDTGLESPEGQTRDERLWDNRGFIYGSGERQPGYPDYRSPRAGSRSQTWQAQPIQPAAAITIPEEQPSAPRPYMPSYEEPLPQRPAPKPVAATPQATEYVVQRGDTLGHISQKFYGTATKWKKILDYNRDVLKSADKVYPGQKLKIPPE